VSYDKIFDVDDTIASPAIVEAEGTSLTSMIGYTWAYDTRDNPLDPSKGVRVSFGQDLAGVGGDVFHLRSVARATYYHPLWGAVIGNVRGSVGYVTGWNGKRVRIIDRFFKGGQTFRGFERSGIGPRDVGSANKDALGGKVYAIGTVEMVFPIGLPAAFGIRGAVFTDFGTLFDAPNPPTGTDLKDDSSIRASAGFGVLWKSPLGPIRLDFSHAFLKQSYDKTEFFRFSGGTTF
jgi:outer membrane protein insertion porin family